ncbi:MAG: hypothetical protein KIT33_15975 [Candidatus Kapabacteria bacterium]|nr:hypothetical protein [Ignavibacteriota bacterium]MCW5886470.1 hypothetical protein [Candidatus Kapabacteria bacterium]
MKYLLSTLAIFFIAINLSSQVYIGGNIGLLNNFQESSADISGQALSANIETVLIDSILNISIDYFHNSLLLRSIPVGKSDNLNMNVECLLISVKNYLFEQSGIYIALGLGKVISYDSDDLSGRLSLGIDYPKSDLVGITISSSIYTYDFKSTIFDLMFGFNIKIF